MRWLCRGHLVGGRTSHGWTLYSTAISLPGRWRTRADGASKTRCHKTHTAIARLRQMRAEGQHSAAGKRKEASEGTATRRPGSILRQLPERLGLNPRGPKGQIQDREKAARRSLTLPPSAPPLLTECVGALLAASRARKDTRAGHDSYAACHARAVEPRLRPQPVSLWAGREPACHSCR